MSQQLSITHISLSQLHQSTLNPRKTFDQASIEELAASIREKGVLVPILVRPLTAGYEIIAGARRYRACCLAYPEGFNDRGEIFIMPCIVRDMDDEEALEIMIIENLQRQDVHPMEEAAGFRQLVDIKHMSIKEIAARVGKSPQYVAQRMKLMDLIPELQEFFYKGHLTIHDSKSLSALSAEDQKEFFEEELSTWDQSNGVYELNGWELNKYLLQLDEAAFDLSDPDIRKDMGPCTTCMFNSANTLLFPEGEKSPVCLHRQCFKSKTDLSFIQQLELAKEDPAVVIIAGYYHGDKQAQKLVKDTPGVIESGGYTLMDAPDPPDLEYQADPDDFDSEEERQEEIKRLEKEYQEELAEHERNVASGRYKKAYVLAGSSKGKYVYVKLTKSGKAASKAAASDNGSTSHDTIESDIKDEIQRLRDREKRAKVLDEVKVWTEVYKLFDPLTVTKNATPDELSPVEINALGHAIVNKLSYGAREAFDKAFSTAYRKRSKSDDDDYSSARVVDMIRYFFLDTLPPGQVYSGINGDSAVMMKVAEEYWPASVEQIGIKQRDIADKRSARVEQRIKDLQKKLRAEKKKDPSPERDRSVKQSEGVKKGKGIKALITEPESE